MTPAEKESEVGITILLSSFFIYIGIIPIKVVKPAKKVMRKLKNVLFIIKLYVVCIKLCYTGCRGVNMVKFYTNRDNSDYIMLDVGRSIYNLATNSHYKLSKDAYDEVRDIWLKSFRTDSIVEIGVFNEVAIHKNSILAKYLLEHSNHKNVINLDEYVSYDKVVNALNIAMFQDDCKMSNKIYELFRQRTSGFKDDLEQLGYCSKVIDYILNNNNFMVYLEKSTSEYVPSSYVVYEEKKFNKRPLVEKRKVKMIKRG